jgi:acyl-CoA dehydrogenase
MIPRTIFSDEHDIFRAAIARFIKDELVPHHDAWEEAGIVSKDAWLKAGEAGILGCTMPEVYGGAGGNFLHAAIVVEELTMASITGPAFWLHSDVVMPYILRYGTDAQKRQWLPPMVRGEIRGAIALSEPSAGSDLAAIRTTALREGDEYVINGSKVFITNGHSAEMVIVACKTDPSAGSRGISQIIVETDRPGFQKGKFLKKIGLVAQDTAELFFSNLRVPAGNLLGVENRGFYQMMQDLGTERLLQAVRSLTAAEAAIGWTIDYVTQRKAFGKLISDFQNTQFKLAEMHAQTSMARVYLDTCIALLTQSKLDGVEAAKAKMLCVELQGRVVDECLQLHGGWGYIWEFPIARAYADARAARLAGGTVEIMKQIIAKSLLPDAQKLKH